MSINSVPDSPAALTNEGQRPRGSLLIILFTLFIDLLGFSLLFPIFAELMLYYQHGDDGLMKSVMALLEAVIPGVSDERRAAFLGGVVLGLYAVLQFLSAPWWGRLSDRIGRRPVLLATTALNVIGYAVWVCSGNFALLVIGRLINGLAAGNLSTLTAAAADCSTSATRTKVMGAVGATFGAGFLLGPAIGGMAYSWLPNLDGLGWGLNPFSSIALVALLLTVVNLAMIYAKFPETLQQQQRNRDGQPLQPEVTVRLRPLFQGYFLFMVSFTAMELALVFMVRDLLLFTPAQTAWLFVAIGGTSIVIQGGVVRRIAHRVPDVQFASLGLMLFAVGLSGLAAVAWFPFSWLAYVSAMVVSLGSALIFPSLSSWVSKSAPAHMQGAAMGRFRSLGALARVVGPLACAISYFVWGPTMTFALSAMILLIPFILIFLVAERFPLEQSQAPDVSPDMGSNPVA